MQFSSNAKINLGLHIKGKLAGGYHVIETLMLPVGLSDKIRISPSDKFRINCTNNCPKISTEQNLIYRAWELLRRDFMIPAVQTDIEKHIPFGAGLGGGSSNAAFMLKALNLLFGLNLTVSQLKKYAAQIGADCVFFIENQAAFASGTGTTLAPFPNPFKNYKLALIFPNIVINTTEAYASIKTYNPKRLKNLMTTTTLKNYPAAITNDFESVIFPLQPKLATIKQKMYANGAIYAAMSGSGSAIFGIFEQHIPLMTFSGEHRIFQTEFI